MVPDAGEPGAGRNVRKGLGCWSRRFIIGRPGPSGRCAAGRYPCLSGYSDPSMARIRKCPRGIACSLKAVAEVSASSIGHTVRLIAAAANRLRVCLVRTNFPSHPLSHQNIKYNK